MKILAQAHQDNKLIKLIGTNQYFSVGKDGEKFTFTPVGGGFVKALKGDDDSMFEIVDSMPSEYEKGVFHLEDEDNNLIFEGYSIPSKRWNGWATPVFEVEVAKQIAKVVNGKMSEFYKVERDDEKGCFIMEEKDYESTTDLNDFVINVDGQDIVVVDFMSYNWCWEDAHGDEAAKLLKMYVPFQE